MREFINGAEAVARGALKAECDFFAGYPITPATPLLLHMVRELPKRGGIAIQAEDEIGAIGFCLGAAMSGARAMTATSGPGLSLFGENIGAAIMMEIPLVIVDVQRMGPATGGATTGAQGDVQFARWGTSGGFPLIVLAPTDVADCYGLTQRAFDLAERFRSPVILLCDKETILDYSTVDSSSLLDHPVRKRDIAPPEGEFIPFHYDPSEVIPPMSPFGGPHFVRFTTSAHDEKGYLTKSTKHMGRKNRHLEDKFRSHLDEINLLSMDLQEGAETIIVSYGITAQTVQQVVKALREQGDRVSTLTVRSLFPVPEAQMRTGLLNARRVVVVELNQGQYRREIERLVSDHQEVIGVNCLNGELLAPGQIIEMGGLS